MEEYKKIEIYPDVKRTSNLKGLIEIYDSKQFTDWYFGFIEEFDLSSYQCIKSEENNSKEIISSYSDNYVKEGNNDPDWIKDVFDSTIKVNEGTTYSIYLRKLVSKDFIDNFFNKLKEFYHSNGNDINLSLDEFFEESDIELWGLTSYEDLIDNMGGDSSDYEVIHDSTDIDEEYNLIKWFSYEQLMDGEFFVGYD